MNSKQGHYELKVDLDKTLPLSEYEKGLRDGREQGAKIKSYSEQGVKKNLTPQNSKQESLDEIVKSSASTQVGFDEFSRADYPKMIDQLEALLAEEVRKVKIEELELILNGYGWGEGEEAANFIIKDRIAELEKDK